MTVTEAQFNAYARILSENGSYGYHLLELLNEIVNGEWEKSIAYCEEDNDPMEDFNYAGSRWHY